MGLGISVASDAENYRVDEQNFSTHREFEIDEWEDLFQNVLHAPIELERLAGEDRTAFLDRRKRLFQEDLTNKGYEMLGRVWYVFRDTFFTPPEVKKLLKECMELRQKTENKNALSALEKLIAACHEALKAQSGIFLACD